MTAPRPDLGPPIPPNSLSVVLLSRGDGTFHWALGLALPESDTDSTSSTSGESTPDRRYAFRKTSHEALPPLLLLPTRLALGSAQMRAALRAALLPPNL